MESRSARVAGHRPFYALHAGAYDALITDPVGPWVDAVQGALLAAGLPQASVLDAGCETGRHALGLIEHGHDVVLLDASANLLKIAQRRCRGAFAYRADICAPTMPQEFDAITCRGVLNDLVTDEERVAALASFARLLKPDGLLFLDVREATGSARRADGKEHLTEAHLDNGSVLIFTSRSDWRDHLIHVTERYELMASDATPGSVHEYEFEMRPWREEELQHRLNEAGFDEVQIRPGIGRRTPDRLFVSARRES